MDNMKCSLIVPVFNEEENIETLYSQASGALKKIGKDYEIIFIDDGSTDNSYAVLRSLQSKDNNVKAVIFKKNFGQTAAIAAGFDFASVNILITMDADLQNSPSDIPKLIGLLDKEHDVVCGWRKDRKDGLITRRIPSYFANMLISAVTGVKLHDYGCALKAFRRESVKDIKLYGEMHRFLPALAVWTGAKIKETEVSHHPRTRGKSKYGIKRVFKVLADLITVKFLMSYETRPNYIFGGIGFLSFLLGFMAMAIVSYRLFVLRHTEATPMIFMMVLFFTAGIQFILMGLLAEMLIRTNFEAQNKPVYLIKEKINI